MPDQNPLLVPFQNEAVFCLKYGMNKISHCLKQLNDEQIWWRPREEMNAIGNLLIHVGGNMRQWIIAGVGGADDNRARQAEFDERRAIPGSELWQQLSEIVEQAETAIRQVSEEDLLRATVIQGHDTNFMQAIWHSVTHFQGHVQEIIGMTRQQLGSDYQFEWEPSSPAEGA